MPDDAKTTPEPEAPPQAPPEPTPPEPEARVEATPEPPPDPEEGEPGGDDPQAVRARKEYRGRKRAQEEAQREREARIAAEARATVLEESRRQAPPPPAGPPAPPAYKPSDLMRSVSAGTVTREDAEAYIGSNYPALRGKPLEAAVAAEVVQEQMTALHRQSQVQTVEARANTEIQDYVKHVPALAQTTSREFQDVAKAYQGLVQEGYPDHITTQRLALRTVFGPLERVASTREAQMDQRRNAPAQTGGDGTGRRPDAQTKPPSNLTDRQRDFIKQRGGNPADYERVAAVHTVADWKRTAAAKKP